MMRLCLIGSFLLLGFEGFRVWWFHAPSTRERWSEEPHLVVDAKALEASTPLRSDNLLENVNTGGLNFDSAQFFRLPGELAETNSYSFLFMEYRAGNESLWNDLFTHPPEVCMRSSGCTLEKVPPSRYVEFDGWKVPVRILKYREPFNKRPLFLLKLVWLPRESPIQPRTDRPEKRPLWIRMALSRVQSPPGAVILARVRGMEDENSAWRIFETQIAPFLELSQ